MNAFQRHGINHLSASSVNLFVHQPALWCMEKLLKKRGKVGAAAHRGTASEAGIVHGLLNDDADLAACQDIALREFDRLTALSADPRREKEREAVPGIVATGLGELRLYGRPSHVQAKIEKTLPGVPVPFIGYIDLGWEDHAVTLDIKSQLRLSSCISTDHARQVALYIHGTNHQARVAYCSPSKIGVYVLEDAQRHIADLVTIAQTMERFLSLSDDPAKLTRSIVPDLDSYFYGDPTTAALAREVFGFAPEIARPMAGDEQQPAARKQPAHSVKV